MEFRWYKNSGGKEMSKKEMDNTAIRIKNRRQAIKMKKILIGDGYNVVIGKGLISNLYLTDFSEKPCFSLREDDRILLESKQYFINFGFKIISFMKYLRGLK